MLDLQTHDVVSDLTDGNEQLSVMRYSPGQITEPKLGLSVSSQCFFFLNSYKWQNLSGIRCNKCKDIIEPVEYS